MVRSKKEVDYGVKYIRHNIPPSLLGGSKQTFGVVVRNTGKKVWHREPLDGHSINMAVWLDDQFAGSGFLVAERVASSKKIPIFFAMEVPPIPGLHLLKIDMVVQGESFFEDLGSKPLLQLITIEVTPNRNRRWAMYDRFFKYLYLHLPILVHGLLWHGYKYLFLLFRRHPVFSERILLKWKSLNKKLSLMEREAQKASPFSLPRNIVLDTTTRCNLRCMACFRQNTDSNFSEAPDMPEDVLDQVIDELFPTGESVNLSVSGEPLLSPYWDKMLEAMGRFHVGLALTTNGTLLGDIDFVNKIVPVLKNIEISVDGATPEVFEKLRPGARFDRVIENARRIGMIRSSLPDPKFDFGFSMTLFQLNMRELPGMVRLVAEAGGNFLRVTFGVLFKRELSYLSVLNRTDEYNEIYTKATENARKWGVHLFLPQPFVMDKGKRGNEKFVCECLYRIIYVTHQGEMTTCAHRCRPLVLDLEGKRIRSLWKGAGMKALRGLHNTGQAHPSCRDCYILHDEEDTLEKRRKRFLLFDSGIYSRDWLKRTSGPVSAIPREPRGFQPFGDCGEHGVNVAGDGRSLKDLRNLKSERRHPAKESSQGNKDDGRYFSHHEL